MDQNPNGRNRPTSGGEYRRTNAPAGERRPHAPNGQPRRPVKISLLSAILTGRRSRGLACVAIAIFISLSAVISVAASIAASHREADGQSAETLAVSEKQDKSVDETDVADGSETQTESDESAPGGKKATDDKKDSETDDTEETDEESADETESGTADPDETKPDETEDTDKDSDGTETGEDETDVQTQTVVVREKHTVRINFFDKESIVSETVAETLGAFITTSGIELTDAQLANLDLSMEIDSDITVDADRLSYTTEDVEEAIPYETEYRESDELPEGTTEVTQEGIEGKQFREYTLTLVNGVEISREQSGSWIASLPQNEIITVGTGKPAQTDAAENGGASDGSDTTADDAPSDTPQEPELSTDETPDDQEIADETPSEPTETPADEPGTEPTSNTIVGADGTTYTYSSAIDVMATCYYSGGYTAYGLPADEGVIGVGLDENGQPFIPFGTRVYVVGPYGDFGVRIAADIGFMYGEKIDICLDPDNPYAYNFGWREMKVYILD